MLESKSSVRRPDSADNYDQSFVFHYHSNTAIPFATNTFSYKSCRFILFYFPMSPTYYNFIGKRREKVNPMTIWKVLGHPQKDSQLC